MCINIGVIVISVKNALIYPVKALSFQPQNHIVSRIYQSQSPHQVRSSNYCYTLKFWLKQKPRPPKTAVSVSDGFQKNCGFQFRFGKRHNTSSNEHFGIIRFWVVLQTNRQTYKETVANILVILPTSTNSVGMASDILILAMQTYEVFYKDQIHRWTYWTVRTHKAAHVFYHTDNWQTSLLTERQLSADVADRHSLPGNMQCNN